MKTKFAIAAIALALSSSAVFASSLKDLATNTVTFNGEVKASSCNVNINGQGNNAVVTLAPIDVSDLQSKTVVQPVDFQLEVTNCAITKDNPADLFTLTWTSATLADSTDNSLGLLKNDIDTGAKNVYLSLVDGLNNSVIVPGVTNHQQKVPSLTPGKYDGVSFMYRVGYNTEDASKATAGHLQSKATYTLSYE